MGPPGSHLALVALSSVERGNWDTKLLCSRLIHVEHAGSRRVGPWTVHEPFWGPQECRRSPLRGPSAWYGCVLPRHTAVQSWASGPNCRLKLKRIEMLAELSNGPHSFLQETLASLNNMQSNLSHWMGLSWVGWKIDIFRCTHFIKLNVELILFEGDTETFDSLWDLSMSNNSGMENIFHALASVHSHHLVMIAIHLNQRICVIE